MTTIAAIRLKGTIKVRGDVEHTMRMMGLRKKLSVAVLPASPMTRGMLIKSQDFVAWGEVSPEMEKTLAGKITVLKAPKTGFISLKQYFPKGDLGYHGDKINELLKRMIK